MRVEGALTPHNSSLHHQRSFQQLSLNGSNHTPRCITCTRGQYTVTKFNCREVKEVFEKNLGMEEWAPPFFPQSSPTPLPPFAWQSMAARALGTGDSQ